MRDRGPWRRRGSWVFTTVLSHVTLARQEVWLTGIQPYTGDIWDAGVSMVVGAEIMREEINANPAILPNHELKVVWQDSLCDRAAAADLLMQNVFDKTYEAFAPGVPLDQLDADGDGKIETSDTAPMTGYWDRTQVSPDPVGLLGGGCSGVTLNLVNTAYYARLPMISGSSTRTALSDRSEYPNFFRTILPDTFFCAAWMAITRMLGYTTITSVIEDTESWVNMVEELMFQAQAYGITMNGLDLSSEIPGFHGLQVATESQTAAKEAAVELVRLKERMVVVLMYAKRTRLLFCEAVKLGFANAIYMVFGWLANGWWEIEDTDCTAAQITAHAMHFISANMMFWRSDNSNPLSCSTSMTSEGFKQEWFARQNADYDDLSMLPEGYVPSPEAATTADALCMFALMIHELLENRGIPLANLTARTQEAYDNAIDVLSNTDFQGVQGPVRFQPGEADPKGFVMMQHLSPDGSICDVASFNEGTMNFFGICDLQFGFEGETFFAGPAGADSITAQLQYYTVCPDTMMLNMESNECESCPAGQVYLQAFGACACGPGYVPSPTDQNTCVPCNPGNFTATAGSEVCLSCEPGWFSGSSGATQCETCAVGTYSGDVAASECQNCPQHMTTEAERSLNASYCDCEVGRFRRRGTLSCEPCLEGQTCEFASAESNFAAFGGNDLRVPMLEPGFFTEFGNPLSVFECKREALCPGGLPQTCMGEVEGFLCYKCPNDQSVNEDYEFGCEECAAGTQVVFFLAPLLLCVVAAVTYKLSNDKLKVKASVSLTASISVGLVLTILQVFSIFKGMSVPWPSGTGGYYSSLSFLTLDAGALSLECSVGTAATTLYFFRVLTPFCVLLCIAFCMGISIVLASVFGSSAIRWEGNKAFNTACHLSQALFIAFAVICVRPLECFPHPNGESSVHLFPQVLCGSGEHTGLLVLAALLLVFFLAPFVALCVWGNYVAPTAMLEPGTQFHVRFRFLFYRFRPDVWWWGNIFMMRQLLLAFASSLPSGDPHSQIFYTIITLVLYVAVSCRLWPWKNAELNALDSASCVILVLVMLTGTAFVEASPEKSTYVDLLIFFIVIKWLVICVMVVLVAYSAIKDQSITAEFQLSQSSISPQAVNETLDLFIQNYMSLDEAARLEHIKNMNTFDRRAIIKCVSAWACGGNVLTRSTAHGTARTSLDRMEKKSGSENVKSEKAKAEDASNPPCSRSDFALQPEALPLPPEPAETQLAKQCTEDYSDQRTVDTGVVNGIDALKCSNDDTFPGPKGSTWKETKASLDDDDYEWPVADEETVHCEGRIMLKSASKR